MPAVEPLRSGPAPTAWASFFAALTWRSVAVALVLATIAALVLSPIFVPPLPVVLGRTLFVALLCLLAFTAAGLWRQRLLPRWLVQVLAVALAAPLAAFAVYLLSTGGDWALLRRPERITGIFLIGGTGLVVGIVLALGALYRERDAQASALALQFALERETLERQAADARLALLEAQIEPHFLFNTLANVQALVEGGSARAAPVLGSLIAYLRAAMPGLHDGAPTLGQEEQRVRAYLELMQMRMPDRLRWQVAIDPALRELRLPPMALLTLVENAVRHGIDPGEAGGEIMVAAERDVATGRIRLTVTDTGVGLAETAPPGTGLANLRARLVATYGGAATLTLHENQPHGLRAEIECPAPPPIP